MKHLSLYLLLVALGVAYCQPSHAAAWTSVNFDEKLVEAMTVTFADEAVTEGLYREATSYILNHYTAAEVASAGIFAAKYMERLAMKKAGIFGEESKNYYYQRIYNMVKNKIMPKTPTGCRTMPVKHRGNTIRSGSISMMIITMSSMRLSSTHILWTTTRSTRSSLSSLMPTSRIRSMAQGITLTLDTYM